MSRVRDTLMFVSAEDLRLAKSIASFKGITLKEYFGMKVREDMKNPPFREFLSCGVVEDRYRRRR